MKKNPLREIEGVRLRRNYFSWALYLFLLLCAFVALTLTFLHLADGTLTAALLAEILYQTVAIFSCLAILPLLILTLLNRRCFGRIVCVLNEQGIHHVGGLLRWQDIERVAYNVNLRGRHPNTPCSAIFYCKNGSETEVLYAPLSVLRRVRRRCPAVQTGLTSSSKFLLILIAAVEILVPVIALIAA